MSTGLAKLGDDVSYGIADPGYLRKPVFGDEHMQRYSERRQAIGGAPIGFRPVGIAATQRGSLRVLSQEPCYGASVEGRHSTSLLSSVLRPRRVKATLNSRTDIRPTVERSLKLLRCAEVLEVLRVRAISGFFLEQIIDAAGHQLQMLHPAMRHRSRLAKSSDGVGPEVVKCV
jgi:hypothetical protein